MKSLVTGANGFLGSRLVERLLETTDDTVACLVRPGSNDTKLSALEQRFPDRIERLTGTLSNTKDCEELVQWQPDTLYHLAAGVTGPAVELFLNGSVATRNLLDAVVASEHTPLLVYCSSFGVYHTATLESGSLIDESSALEPNPEQRDLYSFAKLHQEQLVQKYREEHQIPTVIVRPGVIYGPGGPAISSRVGLNVFGIFLFAGGNNALPLTFVSNCADGFIRIANSPEPAGRVFNIVDDDLPTAREFLRQYRRRVKKVLSLPVPPFLMKMLASAINGYSRWSKGQLPAILTPYKAASIWKTTQFSNAELKSTGWQPEVSTSQGLEGHFSYLANSKNS
ncbi:MAG: NAD-dependent epimerase/dehydratase family protein [Lysobacterales bacterium]